MKKVKIIGAGLAGTECALYLADHGVKVELFDLKPHSFTPAHTNKNYAELVCSNSLKSNDIYGNAAGLLKEELRILGSKCMEAADKTKVSAGNALAVNREEFSSYLTDLIKANKNISCFSEEVSSLNQEEWTIISTGPLTSGALYECISNFTGESLHFYDASAPIISFDSIDMNNAFFGDRYGKGNGDHINCPLNKEEYDNFITELVFAKRAKLHDFEKKEVFEGCMPIEIMASRGKETLRFGPLKPTGLDDPKTGRWPYACLQLRKEDQAGYMYNLIGFQTNLTFSEQKRVFGIIPALKNAEFLRFGVMHRNSFINSPSALNLDFSLKEHGKIFFAGQITGVEGYVESIGSGIATAIYCLRKMNGQEIIKIPTETVLGSLLRYVTTENVDFQPMNANFGILPPLNEKIKDKSKKKRVLAERSIEIMKQFVKENDI